MRPAALSSAALALVAAGCLGGGSASSSGGPHLTRAQYEKAASIVCRRYQQRITALRASTDLSELADQGAKAVALERAEVAALRKLAPPQKDAAAIDGMLKAVESATVAGDALVTAARSGDAAAVADAAARLRSQLAAANRLAKPFGLDLCTR
jgi:hypothetical protein